MLPDIEAPPIDAERVSFDAQLIDLSFTIDASNDAAVVRVSFTEREHAREQQRTGLLTVAPSRPMTPESDQVLVQDADPVESNELLLAAVNGAEPLQLDALPAAELAEGYTLVLRACPARIDFGSGAGVRHLAAYTDDHAPLSDRDLYYVFEGLTRDGRYHVRLRLPVSARALPDDPEPTTLESSLEFAADTDAYLARTYDLLESADAGAFEPTLERLDAFVRSIELR